jgi:hypothetical protein
MNKTVRIGGGAGFSGDRIDPAVDLVERGNLDYLAFECLAERTIGLAQAARLQAEDAGFDILLDERMRAVLPAAHRHGVRIVSNMGAANVPAAARRVTEIARDLGLSGYCTAAVLGDDVLEAVLAGEFPLLGGDGSSRDLGDRIVSANAYLGTEGIVSALGGGADTVITGRVCDASLFLGPLIHEFGWKPDDWERLGQGTVVGHLLECAGQLTGGYFADPGVKDVPRLARLGFPYADVEANGEVVFGKLPGTGGRLDSVTCKEQLLYEILDPGAYLQADVIADFRRVQIVETGPDRVRVTGGAGRARPDTLKVTICYDDGYAGEGQISYAGPGALARAELALEVVRDRLRLTGAQVSELHFELMGVNAVDRRGGRSDHAPTEVRARVVGRAASLHAAERIGREVEALGTNGPSGGGGFTRNVRSILAVASTLIDRRLVTPRVQFEVA